MHTSILYLNHPICSKVLETECSLVIFSMMSLWPTPSLLYGSCLLHRTCKEVLTYLGLYRLIQFSSDCVDPSQTHTSTLFKCLSIHTRTCVCMCGECSGPVDTRGLLRFITRTFFFIRIIWHTELIFIVNVRINTFVTDDGIGLMWHTHNYNSPTLLFTTQTYFIAILPTPTPFHTLVSTVGGVFPQLSITDFTFWVSFS